MHGAGLKDKLLKRIPDLSAHSDRPSKGHGVLLIFDEDVADLVREASLRKDYDMDAIHLVEAAKVARASMIEHKSSFVFDGSFPTQCQEQDIPKPLKALVDMILQRLVSSLNQIVQQNSTSTNYITVDPLQFHQTC